MNDSNDLKLLKGVGEKRTLLFEKLGVFNLDSLLRLYPRNYEDWSKPLRICEATLGKTVCVKAIISSHIKEHFIRKDMTVYKFSASDGDDVIAITIFNNKYLAQKLKIGGEYLFYGKITGDFSAHEMVSPKIMQTNNARLKPLYPAVDGLPSYVIEGIIKDALIKHSFCDTLPESIKMNFGLCDLVFAINNIHFPKNQHSLIQAKKRLVFEELFILRLGLLLKKSGNRRGCASVFTADFTDEFISRLPFKLTQAQCRVIKEAVLDTQSAIPMARLIQGDVGSGKTVVASALMYNAVKNGFQTVMMVPTEILAKQHFDSFLNFFGELGFGIELLIGSMTKTQKIKVKEKLLSGECRMIIGTHALIEDDVKFCDLGLVVTDEQHRFGVAQRTRLAVKGKSPHMLVMSATPIPRTIALVIYGDLDLSIMDELPKGRRPIESYAVNSGYHQRIYRFIKKAISEGRQAYIVCPAVEESESPLIAAQEHFENLSKDEFKNYKVGLIHGKMKSKQKDEIMAGFVAGELDLLVATTVIEVGIDVPNATVMVIENAERFGLSQLHQLRGRIGRGEHQSTCIFVSDSAGYSKRLQIMCKSNDGFKIADEDLKLRGPGDFMGGRQHGLPQLKIADLSSDMDVLKAAGDAAEKLLQLDPMLQAPENKQIKQQVRALFAQTQQYGYN